MAKTRVPNKVIWGLEDIIAICNDAREEWRKAMNRAKSEMDPILLESLVEIGAHLTTIEGKALNARQGKYWDRRGEGEV